VTPIVAAIRNRATYAIQVHMASGAKTVDIPSDGAFGIGRSRAESLVIDWAHASVSGHHAEITASHSDGVRVRVHGDNGVHAEGGVQHPAGGEFDWRAGETIVLGQAVGDEPVCSLTLVRAP
jgi:hypothetical protein